MSGPDFPRAGFVINRQGKSFDKQLFQALPLVVQLQTGLRSDLTKQMRSSVSAIATLSALQMPRDLRDQYGVQVFGIGTINQQGDLYPQGTIPPQMRVATTFQNAEGTQKHLIVSDGLIQSYMSHTLQKDVVYSLVNANSTKRPENPLDRYIRLQDGILRKISFKDKDGDFSEVRYVPEGITGGLIDLIHSAELINRDRNIIHTEPKELVRTFNNGGKIIFMVGRVEDVNLLQRLNDASTPSDMVFNNRILMVYSKLPWLLKAFQEFYTEPRNEAVSKDIIQSVAVTLFDAQDVREVNKKAVVDTPDAHEML